MMKAGCIQFIITEIFFGGRIGCNRRLLIFNLITKQGDNFIFLVAWRWRLFLALPGKFFLQAAPAVTVHFWFVPVLAKVFCDIVFVGIILSHSHNLAKGL
jgi:hypothetical protein